MMKNNIEIPQVKNMISNYFEDTAKLGYYEQTLNQEIEVLKDQLSNIRAARQKILTTYNCIKSKAEFDELMEFAELFPEIFSIRQLQVIFYIVQFKTNKEIGKLIFVSDKTIKYHKTQIYNNLDVMGEKQLCQLYEKRKSLKAVNNG